MAAVCHDIGHDGYTNSYHVNAHTDRAIDYNDYSVQESFHASEFFRIMNQEEYYFLEDISRDQYKVFRKNVVNFILATDMAKHAADLAAFNAICTGYGIKDGENLEKMFENKETITQEKNTILTLAMHACDVSQQGRKFEVAKEWTYLLFDEFFDQGDLEKYKNLPITMLCDRVTVNVAAS